MKQMCVCVRVYQNVLKKENTDFLKYSGSWHKPGSKDFRALTDTTETDTSATYPILFI